MYLFIVNELISKEHKCFFNHCVYICFQQFQLPEDEESVEPVLEYNNHALRNKNVYVAHFYLICESRRWFCFVNCSVSSAPFVAVVRYLCRPLGGSIVQLLNVAGAA